jgi:hypothetical protein
MVPKVMQRSAALGNANMAKEWEVHTNNYFKEEGKGLCLTKRSQ